MQRVQANAASHVPGIVRVRKRAVLAWQATWVVGYNMQLLLLAMRHLDNSHLSRDERQAYLARVRVVFMRDAVAAVTLEILQRAKLPLQQLLQLCSHHTITELSVGQDMLRECKRRSGEHMVHTMKQTWQCCQRLQGEGCRGGASEQILVR